MRALPPRDLEIWPDLADPFPEDEAFANFRGSFAEQSKSLPIETIHV